jgi:hypothetical protein
MLSLRLSQPYKNIVDDLLHYDFRFKIPIIDYEFKSSAKLGDILGVPPSC